MRGCARWWMCGCTIPRSLPVSPRPRTLAWLLRRLGDIGYSHEPLLAPTDTMLKAYRKEKGDWDDYARQFRALMAERRVEQHFHPEDLAGSCLLCSEATPHHCHRRLVCEYLNEKWDGALTVRHL